MHVQESERALFVLNSLAAHMGAWQLALPGQPAAMRRAASALLEFAARSGGTVAERPACCPPVSPDERVAASLPSSLGLNEGAQRDRTLAVGSRTPNPVREPHLTECSSDPPATMAMKRDGDGGRRHSLLHHI